jgi:general secretion pathway protein G
MSVSGLFPTHVSSLIGTTIRFWGIVEMDKRKGFTLIELVVVVMILGILAAVAAPKLLDTSATATDNGVRQTLAVVRDAIERYAAENGGTLPGASDQTEATFKVDIEPYLRGPFPTCPVGDFSDPGGVDVIAGTDITAGAAATKGWRYSYESGEFIINTADDSASDDSITYEEF